MNVLVANVLGWTAPKVPEWAEVAMRTADGAGVGGGGAAMHGQGAGVDRGSRVRERRFLRG